ncbi:acid protease [Sporormia fimetaria CBS 119925]|uniref:Acid protease n=1 Tax=Sporormia fimetaria CBS 119925 TaxID=1340428 RepID=A0A6A6V6X6_9PLEO|nr:acid protease [Sporormia fimetaria CBS 119925]
MYITPRAESETPPAPYEVQPSKEFDGNDGAWSTFKISVGNPGQDLRVLVSTQSAATQVIVPEGCLPGEGEECPRLRGAEIFKSAQSPGFQVNESTTWSAIGQYDLETETRLNMSAKGLFGFDRFALGPAASDDALFLDHQLIAGTAEMNYYLGHIPLGTQDYTFSSLGSSVKSFFYQLRMEDKIPSLSFAYTAGAKYRLKSVFGSLILGGYDSSRFTPNKTPFSFTLSTDPSRLLTVGVESILATNTLKGSYSLSSTGHFSLIDTTVPHLWLPPDICDNFADAFGLTYDVLTDLYLVNTTIHTELLTLNPSISLKLTNSLTDTTNSTNIVLPYSAFDLQASYPYYTTPTNYFPIRRAANESQYTLGRTLLQEAYLIVDYERANFTLAQAAFPDPLPPANIIPIVPPSRTYSGQPLPDNSSQDSKPLLSKPAIIGIAIGVSVFVVLIIFSFRRNRRRALGLVTTEKQKHEVEDTGVVEKDGKDVGARTVVMECKADEPQELGGTGFAELASPQAGTGDRKEDMRAINWGQPQELPSPTPPPARRWAEVGADGREVEENHKGGRR